TPTQRADGGIGTHGELLLSEAIQGPRSFLRTGLPAPTMVSSRLATNPRSGTPRSGYRGSDLVQWHQAPIAEIYERWSAAGGRAVARLLFCPGWWSDSS